MIMTVGDQIFALNQEVKKLKRKCQQYETVLRDIAAGSGQAEYHDNQNAIPLARHALTAGTDHDTTLAK